MATVTANSPITATVPAAWVTSPGPYDLALINLLKSQGIPATEVYRGKVQLAPGAGALTVTVSATYAVFSFTPAPPPVDPKDVKIAALQKQIADAAKKSTTDAATIAALQAKIAAADQSLKK